MGFGRLVLLVSIVVSFAALTWLGLMYRIYGKNTLLYLLQRPDQLLTYSKAIIASPTPMPNNGVSLDNGPLDTAPLERPRPSLPPVDSSHTIAKMTHAYQKLNNCGPVTASMAASTYGISFDQFYAASQLKGGDGDKNIGPLEMVRFLESQGLKAAFRINGNPEILEQFISRDMPVMVAQWLLKESNGELVGHYRAVRGYDKERKIFITNDSYNGPNFVIPYAQFDEWWRPFGRTYIVVYKAEQQEIVEAILGPDWDKNVNNEGAVANAKSEIASIGDFYSYFNLGTAYTMLHDYPNAALAYDQALKKVYPPLFLWYEFGPLEAYYQVSDFDKVFNLTNDLLSEAGEVEEAHYYRGLVYKQQGKLVEARIEEEKTFAANPRFIPPFE